MCFTALPPSCCLQLPHSRNSATASELCLFTMPQRPPACRSIAAQIGRRQVVMLLTCLSLDLLQVLHRNCSLHSVHLEILSNPKFLAEGTAVARPAPWQDLTG